MGVSLVDGGVDVIDVGGGILAHVFGIADAVCNTVDINALGVDTLLLMLTFLMVLLMLLTKMLLLAVFLLVAKALRIW